MQQPQLPQPPHNLSQQEIDQFLRSSTYYLELTASITTKALLVGLLTRDPISNLFIPSPQFLKWAIKAAIASLEPSVENPRSFIRDQLQKRRLLRPQPKNPIEALHQEFYYLKSLIRSESWELLEEWLEERLNERIRQESVRKFEQEQQERENIAESGTENDNHTRNPG